LVVKTQAGREHPYFRQHARAMAAGRSDIIFLEGELSRSEAHNLLASCDIVLSPHRAEGFGLSLAEAIILGRPVLATGWSGNMDFMSGAPEGLIDYKLTPVTDPSGIYCHSDQCWAEPDLDDGARKLRELSQSPELRQRVVSKARQALLELSKAWSTDGEMARIIAPRINIDSFSMSVAPAAKS
jgi:glycosyltransferase involved in cell wall biosynthesis